MSFKLKQRFGEVLALALIVTIVGFLVYMLIPTNPKTPKSQPVTVRSTAKLETQSHVATTSEQTPSTSHVLQETTVQNASQNAQGIPASEPNSNSDKNTSSKKPTQQQNGNAQGIVSVSIKSTCTPTPKSVTKVSSILQSIPVVGSLVADVTNCAS